MSARQNDEGCTKTWHTILAPLLVEFYGTFFLTFTANMAGSVTVSNTGMVKAYAHTPELAIGMVLALLVYSGGHISGGHYNPAVTLGIVLRGKIEMHMVPLYMASQFLAGMSGACAATYLTGQLAYPYVADVGQAMCMSMLFTFLLVQTVLATATSKAVLGNQFFGLCIGMVVFVFASLAGQFPGSAVNPAVASGNHFAAWTMKDGLAGGSYLGGEWNPAEYDGKDYWVVLVGPFAGAILAALWYRITSPNEFNTKKHGLPAQGHVHQNLKSSNLGDILDSRAEAGSSTERSHIVT